VKLDNFFAELKRRNVVRMAGLYLVGAWLLTQVASTVLPMFGAPDWLPRSIVILLTIGFAPALIFSWVFELTPQGLKRDEDVRPEESIAPQTARRMDRMIIAVLVLALAYFAVDKFVLGPRRVSSPNDSSPAINTKSIAVLPFDNLSRDPDNVYFCEGVQDEILTRLAKVADLKVISRTSTQHFKSTPENLPAIAKQLGVMHILEGSVQKSNDQVRVNVQLINAMTDAHLWADTFDRKLTDIFAVESEIAKTIAETLQAKITGSEKSSMAETPTANPEAYELYLKGRFFWNKRSGVDLRKAIDFFNQAIGKIRIMRSRMPAWPTRICCYRITAERLRQTSSRQRGLRSPKRLSLTIRWPKRTPRSVCWTRSISASNAGLRTWSARCS
jgi:TolB-like protein